MQLPVNNVVNFDAKNSFYANQNFQQNPNMMAYQRPSSPPVYPQSQQPSYHSSHFQRHQSNPNLHSFQSIQVQGGRQVSQGSNIYENRGQPFLNQQQSNYNHQNIQKNKSVGHISSPFVQNGQNFIANREEKTNSFKLKNSNSAQSLALSKSKSQNSGLSITQKNK